MTLWRLNYYNDSISSDDWVTLEVAPNSFFVYKKIDKQELEELFLNNEAVTFKDFFVNILQNGFDIEEKYNNSIYTYIFKKR